MTLLIPADAPRCRIVLSSETTLPASCCWIEVHKLTQGTPMAVRHCHILRGGTDYADIFNILLDRGATVDAADSSGRTPLSHCAEFGYPSACRLLLDRGAAVNSADSNGRTPLSYSAESEEYYSSRCLLDGGATTDVPDVNGHTPLWYAHQRGDWGDIYQLLLMASQAERNS